MAAEEAQDSFTADPRIVQRIPEAYYGAFFAELSASATALAKNSPRPTGTALPSCLICSPRGPASHQSSGNVMTRAVSRTVIYRWPPSSVCQDRFSAGHAVYSSLDSLGGPVKRVRGVSGIDARAGPADMMKMPGAFGFLHWSGEVMYSVAQREPSLFLHGNSDWRG